uniref:U3 small nucleolar RNA-associated protein 15 homolog n=1 Tax=Phlebotomus papatasi TaxID=29031 RepID=A0A1B0F0L7_PHLPP
MSQFKPINFQHYTSNKDANTTPDHVYWKRLGMPVLAKEFGTIDYIDFSPVEPYYFAVTCSVRVQIYNPITKLVVKNLSRFQESAYGGCFRNDGRLVVAGDEEGFVKLFDVSSKNILRLFKGHKNAVHRAAFRHTDYIRAGCTSPVSPHLLLSGGYDHTIKMLDTRMPNEQVLQVNHESPVESLIYLPSGGVFVSAGGTHIKVWDAMSGGKLLANVTQHHKTITCLKLANNGRRLLSGSLDHNIKIYDVSNYECVHTINYPNSVLSLGISADDETLVAGMVDGLLSIRRMETEDDLYKQKSEGKKEKQSDHINEVVHVVHKPSNIQADKYLRAFEYSKALDCTLSSYIVSRNPHLTVCVIQELIRRKGLTRAFSGRSYKSLSQLLRFFNRYISDYRFTRVLVDAVNILLNIYGDSIHTFPKEFLSLFKQLAKKLKHEEYVTYSCLQVQGCIDLLISNSALNVRKEYNEDLKQSENAKKLDTINIY